METAELVKLYRNEPDPDDKRRDTLIMRHMAMTRKIASRFVCPTHNFDDCVEFAQYELVKAVIKAKDSLVNNNIRPFLLKRIKCRLTNYVRFSHKPLVPEHASETAQKHDWPSRVMFVDAIDDDQYPVDETVLLNDTFQCCIDDPLQRDVVKWRLAGCSFRETGEHVGIPLHQCQMLWHEFCGRVREAYDELL